MSDARNLVKIILCSYHLHENIRAAKRSKEASGGSVSVHFPHGVKMTLPVVF